MKSYEIILIDKKLHKLVNKLHTLSVSVKNFSDDFCLLVIPLIYHYSEKKHYLKFNRITIWIKLKFNIIFKNTPSKNKSSWNT